MTSDKISTISKALVLPLFLGTVGAYFNYRLAANKQASEAGYGVMAPAVKDLQEQVKSLTVKMDLLTELVPKLTYASRTPAATSTTVAPPAAVVLLKQFQRSPSRALSAPPVPQSLDDAAAMKK